MAMHTYIQEINPLKAKASKVNPAFNEYGLGITEVVTDTTTLSTEHMSTLSMLYNVCIYMCCIYMWLYILHIRHAFSIIIGSYGSY